MTVIRAARFKGVIGGDDTETGEQGVTIFAVEAEDGSDVYVRVPAAGAYESVLSLITALSAAARTATQMQVLIGAQGWQTELPPGPQPQPILHAYLPGEQSRLSFQLQPGHVRPLSENLRQLADQLDGQAPPPPMPPTSQARN